MTDLNKYSQVELAFSTAYPGVRFDGIFCSLTGEEIGQSYETSELIDSLSGDAEEIADDIALRIFASMRPSMKWNVMRADSLEVMRKAEPISTACYLLNSLFRSRTSNQLAHNHDAIRLFSQMTKWSEQETFPAWLESVTYYLLEVDARLGLKSETATFKAEDFLDQFVSFDILTDMIVAWNKQAMIRWAKLEKQNELNTKWWRSGNALAKPAFFAAFMESKPLSATAQAKAEKRVESDFFGELLNEVLGKPKLDGTEQAPRPIFNKPTLPSTKIPSLWRKKSAGESQA